MELVEDPRTDVLAEDTPVVLIIEEDTPVVLIIEAT